MREDLAKFLTDETGAVALDWIVLTTILVGTGLSVMLTVRGGVETSALSVTNQLEGQVIRSSFQTELCPEGVPGLQARETERAAAAGAAALDVAGWMATTYASASDAQVRDAFERDAQTLGGSEAWTVDRIRFVATGCELVLRGLD